MRTLDFPIGFLELSPVFYPLGNITTSKTVVILHSLLHIFHEGQFSSKRKEEKSPSLTRQYDLLQNYSKLELIGKP